MRYLDVENHQVIFPLPDSIKYDHNRCKVVLKTDLNGSKLEIVGFKTDVDDISNRIMSQFEKVQDALTDLTLTQIRLLKVNKYEREMQMKLSDLECKVIAKELRVIYNGRRIEVFFILNINLI